MKIIFLVDYIGRETAMKEYKAGDSMELDHAPAQELIGFGVAKEAGARAEPKPVEIKIPAVEKKSKKVNYDANS